MTAIETYFPENVSFTRLEGGMFILATLPEDILSIDLFEKAKKENVVFVPGNPFYVDRRDANTMRLNYTNCDTEVIFEGIQRLGKVIK